MWELFGFRGWSLTDLDDIDCEDLEMMVDAAKETAKARKAEADRERRLAAQHG